jgi:hypothetical protein
VRNSPEELRAMSEQGVSYQLPRANPAVVFCEVEDGAVLLSTTEETYYGLNAVGARIWSLLPPAHQSLHALCGALSFDYPEVDRAVLQADVVSLLEDLLRNGLVVSS